MRLRLGRAPRIAPSLPVPYPAPIRAGGRFRPGQLSSVSGGPRGGKSQFMNNLVQRTKGIGAQYWSADTNIDDITFRTLAMWSGYKVTHIEQNIHSESWQKTLYGTLGTHADHVDWIFDSQITGRGLD